MGFGWFIDRCFTKQPRLREFVTAALYGRSDCDVEVAGLTLNINRLRENGYLRASRKARHSSLLSHEIHVVSVLSLLASEARTFIDAGANIGFVSCMMAKYKAFYPDYRVMAFEPHPDTYKRLHKNAARYGVETYNYALSDLNERKVFLDGAVSHVFTDLGKANDYNIKSRQVSVECRRLDDIVSLHGSYFIKIDTEGQEIEVLKGAEGLFRSNSVHGVYIDGHAGDSVPQFLLDWRMHLFNIATLRPTDGKAFGILGLRRPIE